MANEPPPAREPVQVTAAEIPGLNALLTLAVSVVVVAGLYFAREVLIPITLAILLSFLVAPLVNLLRRVHLGRIPAVLLAVLVSLGVIGGLAGVLGTQIAQLADDVPRYQSTIERKVEAVRGATLGRLSDFMRGMNAQIERAAKQATAPTRNGAGNADAPAAPAPSAAAPIPVEVHQPNPSPMDVAMRVLTPVLGPLATVAIVFVVAIFILLQREDLRDRLIRLAGSGDLHRTTVAMNDAAGRLSRYFLVQLAINAGFGVVISGGLLVIGVPSPVLWGIVAALLRFIPYVGAPLAAVVPLALAAAVDPGWSMVIWTAGLFLVCELLTGQVIEPMAYGHSTGLSPVAIVVSATFWTWLWGPIGLILSTPLTLCLVVLGRHVQRLEFLDVLLGDRPALTPVESFYQRMLAGDPDEAVEQAELLLRERSLSSYYDEVALRGLQLAANDRLRGVLTERQLDRIHDAFDSLLHDLDVHEDEDPQTPVVAEAVGPSRAERELPKAPAPDVRAPDPGELPPQWSGDDAVLCIAGRGPLDEAASAMLAQLLTKHGLGARVVPNEAVARGRVQQLDLSRTAMICVSFLEISGTPSHLRYLVRRLHQVRPDVPVLIGFWPGSDETLRDERLRAVIGANDLVTSLREAVESCVKAAHAARLHEASPSVAEAVPASAADAPPLAGLAAAD